MLFKYVASTEIFGAGVLNLSDPNHRKNLLASSNSLISVLSSDERFFERPRHPLTDLDLNPLFAA